MTGDEWLARTAQVREELLAQTYVEVLVLVGRAREGGPAARVYAEQAARLLSYGDQLAAWLEVGGDEG